VGGGTSGLTVALRLAESNDVSVAVIEAGSFYEIDSGNFSQITAYESLYLNAPPSMDWGIYTTPQTVSTVPELRDVSIIQHLILLLATCWAVHPLHARKVSRRIVSIFWIRPYVNTAQSFF
jgi:hypothetical protein